MSNNWGIRCGTCRERCPDLRINHGEGTILSMIAGARAVAHTGLALHPEWEFALTVDARRAPLDWLLAHADHDLMPISEYDRTHDAADFPSPPGEE